jgi:hypothetical protein
MLNLSPIIEGIKAMTKALNNVADAIREAVEEAKKHRSSS